MNLAKPKPVRSRSYLSFIHEQECIVCHGVPVEAAHTGEHGLGTKASDTRALPLCERHHRGQYGLDSIGPARFEASYGIDLKESVIYYLTLFLVESGALK